MLLIWTQDTVGFTFLEAPGLVTLCAGSSFSNRVLFLETSSSRNRVLWVTSGERVISDFCSDAGRSWGESHKILWL